jgi:hypothetical protein
VNLRGIAVFPGTSLEPDAPLVVRAATPELTGETLGGTVVGEEAGEPVPAGDTELAARWVSTVLMVT